MPTIPLKGISDHPSYHGAITWAKAELKLKDHGGNCYLTRHSKDRKVYVISVMREGADDEEDIFQHLNLIITDDTYCAYEIEGAGIQFNNIFELLCFYQEAPVNHKISSIGECVECKHHRSRSSSPTGSLLKPSPGQAQSLANTPPSSPIYKRRMQPHILQASLTPTFFSGGPMPAASFQHNIIPPSPKLDVTSSLPISPMGYPSEIHSDEDAHVSVYL